MTPQTLEQHTYSIDVLTHVFQLAAKRKDDAATAFFEKNPDATWAKDWPQISKASEQYVLEWLKAQDQSGKNLVKTQLPIDDKSINANLNAQIRHGMVRAL